MPKAYFAGQYLVTPTVAATVDDSQMFSSALQGNNVLALIGESAGGPPKKPALLRSPLHASQLLRSGPLREAAVRAFDEARARVSILAVRVNPATQSSVTLKDANNTDIMRLVSTDYGAHTASIEVRLEPGSKTGYRVSVRQGGEVYYRDNVGAEVLSLRYTGAEASAQVAVASGKLTLEAPTGTVVREYVLTEWSSAAALAEAISGLTGWTASVPPGQERFAPANLDALSATDAKAAAVMLTGHAWSVFNYINSSNEVLLDAQWIGTPPVAKPAMTSGWVRLTGGVNGNTSVTDWEAAFAALHEIEAHWIVPLSDNPVIWDMAAAHCRVASTNKRERRAFVGGGTGLTPEQALSHARGINSDRVAYVWPAVYEQDPSTGSLILKPAYHAAALLGAAFASLSPGATMSRKTLGVAGAERQLREPIDTDLLLAGGVCPLVQTDRGVIVSQAITTWLVDDRYNKREVSVGAAVDYVVRTVREGLAQFLGERASPDTIPRATNRLTSILSDLAVSPPMGPGVLVGSPPFRNIQMELDGDVLRVSFECSPVIPINYILIGISITPYRSVTTAA